MLRFALATSCVFAATTFAQDWPHWRGPRYDGSSPATGLSTSFSKTKDVKWALDLPGPAACTPIVVGDRVFLSSADTERERLVAMCVDRDTGKVVWKHDAGSGYRPAGGMGSRIARGRRSNYASPSPTTDGERVVFFFGNGDLVAYSVGGEELWRRNVQEDYGDFAFQWTFSASPTLWEGKVFLPVLQRDTPVARRRSGGDDAGGADPEPIESFLLVIDPVNGKTLHKKPRPSPAKVESRESYATPIPYAGKGRKELLIVGGDVITGHDPSTGDELWRWGTWNEAHRERWWRLVPSAVVGEGVAVVCAPKRAPAYAVELGGTGRLDDAALVWKSEGRSNTVSSDVPTPAFHDDHFYVLSDVRSAITKVRAKDGEIIWRVALPRDYLWRASPTVADGNVWLMNHSGDVMVLDTRTGDFRHRAKMGEEDDDRIRSSIVVAHGNVFLRTNTKFFCIGK